MMISMVKSKLICLPKAGFSADRHHIYAWADLYPEEQKNPDQSGKCPILAALASFSDFSFLYMECGPSSIKKLHPWLSRGSQPGNGGGRR